MAKAMAAREKFYLLVEQVDEPKTRAKYDERLDRIDSIPNGINEALGKDWQDIYDAFRVLDYKETKFINMPGGKLDIDPDLRESIKKPMTA